MTIRFPYSRPHVTEEDIACLAAAARGQFLTQGPRVEQFEAAIGERFGADHVIVCNSGTAALHLIYLGLGLGPQTGLITSPLTFLATANAARMCGAPVAFADVDAVTGLMTPETLAEALARAPFPVKAVAPVHLGGRVCDLPGLQAVAQKYGAVLVDDACHAPGAVYVDNAEQCRVGGGKHTAASAFSFHAIKHVAMGEGGAVTTNDPQLAAIARCLRSHGIVRDRQDLQNPPEAVAPWYYEMHRLGWNYRADELACALGLSQLGRLDDGIAVRQRLVAHYDALLADLPAVRRPKIPTQAGENVWHLYPVSIDFAAVGKSRGGVMSELAERGIGTQVHYIPLTHQPYYRAFAGGDLPGVEAYYQQTLSLPLYPQLTTADVTEIVAVLRDVLRG